MNSNVSHLQTRACDPERLELFLRGELSNVDESEFTLHLNSCENCRQALEQQAAEPSAWSEAEKLLKPSQFDSFSSDDDGDSGAENHSIRLPLLIQNVLDALGPTDDPEMLGRLGNYEISGVVGAGGMGVVLKAIDKSLDRTVAIKVLAPHLATSAAARKRFAREAKAAAAVLHPNVVAIHSVSNHETLPYLVMPYVRGTSLQKRLEGEGPLPLNEILRIGSQIAAGLAAAHAQGLVHRDIKPANILLEEGVERVAITDFGLARAVDDATISHSGVIAGTPQYMSPEQARGEPLDGRSDLFSLGCVLYEMATGVSPFRSDSMMATLRKIVDDAPRAMASLNPELPPWFISIVDRLLEKDPARRFDTARAVNEVLEGCLAHLQQPTNVPLPSELPISFTGRGWRSSFKSRKGMLAMIGALGIGLLGALLLNATPPDISGEWTGEEWGTVVLKQAGTGEYTGTYSETVGKGPGTIQLKWSRIERRFNGTWREENTRFGDLTVRRVGDEIRGALTTDAKSKINPATPRLADLTWNRKPGIQAAKSEELETRTYVVADLAPNAAELDRLSERIKGSVNLNWDRHGGSGSIRPYDTTLSLIIRQRQSVHEDITVFLLGLRERAKEKPRQLSKYESWSALHEVDALKFGPVIEQTLLHGHSIDLDTNQKVSPGPEQVLPWITKHGIDVTADLAIANRGLFVHEGTIAIRIENRFWETATPTELGQMSATAKADAKLRVMSPGNDLPATFGFQTREGEAGLLRITGLGFEPSAPSGMIKFQYKSIHLPRTLPLTGRSVFTQITQRVPFKVGASSLSGGDRITIDTVFGPVAKSKDGPDTIKVGNTYEINGTYRLASRDQATLLVSITKENLGPPEPTATGSLRLNAIDPQDRELAKIPAEKSQSIKVKRGEGRFTLVLPMKYLGKPHVSFYPEVGEGFGHVYFGTGDSILEKGWWEAPTNPHDKQLLAQPLDLTKSYQSTAVQFVKDTNFPWRAVAHGAKTFGKIPLAIDGRIALWGAQNAARKQVFAEKVEGITVNRKFATLYVYHATFFSSEEGAPVYHLTFHYPDGSAAPSTIRYGTHVRDWYQFPNEATAELSDPKSKMVWTADHPDMANFKLRFFITSIANPKPGTEVTSLSLASAKGDSAGCILAMTTGPAGLLNVGDLKEKAAVDWGEPGTDGLRIRLLIDPTLIRKSLAYDYFTYRLQHADASKVARELYGIFMATPGGVEPQPTPVTEERVLVIGKQPQVKLPVAESRILKTGSRIRYVEGFDDKIIQVARVAVRDRSRKAAVNSMLTPDLIFVDAAGERPCEEEQRIERCLDKKISLQFDERPLREVIKEVSSKADINVVLDRAGLELEGASDESLVSIGVGNVRTRVALEMLLSSLKLGYIIRNEVLNITSQRNTVEPMELRILGLVPGRTRLIVVDETGDGRERSREFEIVVTAPTNLKPVEGWPLRVISDARSNMVFVFGSEDGLAPAERMIRELDAPQQPAPKPVDSKPTPASAPMANRPELVSSQEFNRRISRVRIDPTTMAGARIGADHFSAVLEVWNAGDKPIKLAERRTIAGREAVADDWVVGLKIAASVINQAPQTDSFKRSDDASASWYSLDKFSGKFREIPAGGKASFKIQLHDLVNEIGRELLSCRDLSELYPVLQIPVDSNQKDGLWRGTARGHKISIPSKQCDVAPDSEPNRNPAKNVANAQLPEGAASTIQREYDISNLPLWSRDGVSQHIGLLLKHLQRKVDPPSWANGSTKVTYDKVRHALIVTATVRNHQDVARHLVPLRAAHGRQVEDRKQAARPLYETRTYLIGDLPLWTRDGKDQNAELLISHLESAIPWDDGTIVREYSTTKSLIIRATKQVHGRIMAELIALRADGPTPDPKMNSVPVLNGKQHEERLSKLEKENTPGEVVIELHAGSKTPHSVMMKVIAPLNKLKGVVVTIRTGGEGDSIVQAIIDDPSGICLKNAKLNDSIDEILRPNGVTPTYRKNPRRVVNGGQQNRVENQVPKFEPFECTLVDEKTGVPVPGNEFAISLRFFIPRVSGRPSQLVDEIFLGPNHPGKFKFTVPVKVLQHPDRDMILVDWQIVHSRLDARDRDPLPRIRINEILNNDPRSAREAVRQIKMYPANIRPRARPEQFNEFTARLFVLQRLRADEIGKLGVIAAFEELLNKFPDHPDRAAAMYEIANCWTNESPESKSDPAKSLDWMRRAAAAARPSTPLWFKTRFQLEGNLGPTASYESAILILDEILASKPTPVDEVRAWRRKQNLAMARGDEKTAEEICRELQTWVARKDKAPTEKWENADFQWEIRGSGQDLIRYWRNRWDIKVSERMARVNALQQDFSISNEDESREEFFKKAESQTADFLSESRTVVPNLDPPNLNSSHHFGTADSVHVMACSPDGKLIAIANGNPSSRLQPNGTSKVINHWQPVAEILDSETGKDVVTLKLTTVEEDKAIASAKRLSHFEVTALAFSPDGAVVAIGTSTGQVKFFNAKTGEFLRSLDDEPAKLAEKITSEKFKLLRRAMGSVASLAFSPDGNQLAVCGTSFQDFARHWGGVNHLGELGTGPGRVKIWEVKTGSLSHDLVGHSFVSMVAFSPDGRLLASAGRWLSREENGDGVILWDPQTGIRIRRLKNLANGGTHAVAFSPNSNLVVSASRRFDKENDTSTTGISAAYAMTGIMEWQQTLPRFANQIAFTADGKSVAVLCQDGHTIRFFDRWTGSVKHQIHTGDSPPGGKWNACAIASQGCKLVTGGVDSAQKGSVAVWEFVPGVKPRESKPSR